MKIIMALYVDDILAAAQQFVNLNLFHVWLQRQFKVRDLGEPTYFLGMNVRYEREQGQIYLSQSTYIDTLLNRFEMENCNPTYIPIPAGVKFYKEQGEEDPTDLPFSSLIGGLLFASLCTRPDIAYAVYCLSRFLGNPGAVHWKNGLQILKYLKGTKTMGVKLGKSTIDELNCYSDADWANDLDDRKSVTGGIILYGNSPIAWTSKKQPAVRTSTAEAEGMAVYTNAAELIYIRKLANELRSNKERIEAIIHVDNQPTLNILRNGKSKVKHLDIKLI